VTANWRPDLRFCVAFNADPADPGAVPIWTNIGDARLRTINQATRGRQYELDQTQASAPTISLLDIDEYLNPANTSSPYYPNVTPYRQCLLQAMWANPASGNLLNSSARAQVTGTPAGVAFDPSFEAQTNGATVPWVTAVGAVVPTVTTTNPRTGTKDLTYTVASGAPSAANQGVSIPVPCTPGVQYTSSLYVRQSSANTQQVFVTDQNQGVDAFNRTTASGWGTADQGGAWTVSGTAADYSTAPGTAPILWIGTAYQSNSATNTIHLSTIGSSILDSDQRVMLSCPVVATGAEIDVGLVARFADSSNYYFAEVRFNTDNTVGLRIQRRVAGTNTSITTATASFLYSANTAIRLRFQVTGTTVQAKVWLDGAVEPASWTATASDANILTAGAVGCRSIVATSNTNTLPVALAFQQYSAVGFVAGTSTATTGSYVRLSVTYTATQPVHTFLLAVPATNSAGLAGTVNMDDLQHEEAASASAYTATGTVLYPVLRDYVERWPSEWGIDSQGFEGVANITGVDAFGPLNMVALLAAYPAAVMATDPAMYWPLWDQSGSSSFAEITGNGPPLVIFSSKAGTGTLPVAGTSMNIIGDPGGIGVAFDPGATPSVRTSARSIIATGAITAGQIPVLFPAVIGTSWAVTVAAWAKLAVNGNVQVIAALVTNAPLFIYTLFLDGNATFIENNVGGTLFATNSASGNIQDNILHHVVGQVIQDSTNTTLNWWIDGVLTGTITVGTGATLGGVQTAQSTSVTVGGTTDSGYVYDGVNGNVAHVAIWNRQLTSTEISNLYQAGTGWSGETSDQRIARYLSGATVNAAFMSTPNYSGPTNIDPAALSVMGTDDLVTGTDLLTACQSVTTTENGVFWVNPTGAVTFAGREIRYLETSSSYTFGEDTANGEFPYQPDAKFDLDPTLIYETVQVTNADGIVVSVTPSSPAYARRWFNRSYKRDTNFLDDNMAIDCGNYLLNQHKLPTQRIDQIVLDPASYPTLWPVVLTIEIGTRVTVKRRVKAANNGVGFTMSADYFVEKVSHDNIDMALGTWQTTLQLSPVDQSQVWILEDATYGVLDSTTILGF
jgi:hypothetical protein